MAACPDVKRTALLAMVLVGSCGMPPPTSTCGPSTGTVARAIDGDTLELADGKKVRMLLVDTPESTNGKTDCYGQEAAQFTSDKVLGKTVQLTYDEASCTDRFGRLLAYVKVDGVEMNKLLAEQGYACILYVAPAGTSRRDEFETYESQAKTARLGMWGKCSVVTCE